MITPRTPSRDLRPRAALASSPEQPPGRYDALNALADELAGRAVEAVDWYLQHKVWPCRLSRLLRALAILAGVLGGLAPLLGGASVSGEFAGDKWSLYANQSGYILIALAGAALLFDRYFGFSSSWMRYMTAQRALQRALENFQLSWAIWRLQVKDAGPDDEQQAAAIALLTAFQKMISELVDQEFQAWVAQFKQELAQLQAAVSKDQVENRPGHLVLDIQASDARSGPADVYLDNRLVRQTDSGSVLLTALDPGSHLVTVKANNGSLQGSKTVNVAAGETAAATVELQAAVANGTVHR